MNFNRLILNSDVQTFRLHSALTRNSC